MILKRLQLGPMANFVYLLGDPETRECAVLDPAWDVPAIRRALEEEGLRLVRVLVSHHHHDHTNGLPELLKVFDVPVHVHEKDAGPVRRLARENLEPARGGERLAVGRLELSLLHTPGHTAGSQCVQAAGRLLTGDTLFIGSCGRVDFPDSDPEKMHASLRKIAALPDDTELLPGHDYADVPSAPLSRERGKNPYLRAASRDLEDFLRLVGA